MYGKPSLFYYCKLLLILLYNVLHECTCITFIKLFVFSVRVEGREEGRERIGNSKIKKNQMLKLFLNVIGKNIKK